jgi:hypothetical protein
LKENKAMAEACGSRTQTIDSQLTANDGVAASAKFQLDSIGVRTAHFRAQLCLIQRGLLPCLLLSLASRTAELRHIREALAVFQSAVASGSKDRYVSSGLADCYFALGMVYSALADKAKRSGAQKTKA